MEVSEKKNIFGYFLILFRSNHVVIYASQRGGHTVIKRNLSSWTKEVYLILFSRLEALPTVADFYKKSGFEVDAVFGGLFLKNDILIPMKKIFGKRWLQFHKVACYFCKLDKIQQEYVKY